MFQMESIMKNRENVNDVIAREKSKKLEPRSIRRLLILIEAPKRMSASTGTSSDAAQEWNAWATWSMTSNGGKGDGTWPCIGETCMTGAADEEEAEEELEVLW